MAQQTVIEDDDEYSLPDEALALSVGSSAIEGEVGRNEERTYEAKISRLKT